MEQSTALKPNGLKLSAKIVWSYGVVFSGMFLLMATVNVALAFLDHTYTEIGTYLMVGGYGAVHFFANSIFHSGSSSGAKWAQSVLLAIYCVWFCLSVASFFLWTDSPVWLPTAIVFGALSALMVAILLRLRNASASTAQ